VLPGRSRRGMAHRPRRRVHRSPSKTDPINPNRAQTWCRCRSWRTRGWRSCSPPRSWRRCCGTAGRRRPRQPGRSETANPATTAPDPAGRGSRPRVLGTSRPPSVTSLPKSMLQPSFGLVGGRKHRPRSSHHLLFRRFVLTERPSRPRTDDGGSLR